MEKNSSVKPDTMRNILTLRYDPTQTPLLPKKNWQDFISKPVSASEEFIEKLIEKNIKNKIANSSEKKIALALSGGIDSTLILAILKKTFPNVSIEAISIKFANSIDETTNAAKIANFFGANHHIVFLENYLSELPKAISIIGLPFWDLHWYYVVKKAQPISKFIASGDGGDELFGGYTFRYKKFLELTNENSTPLEKVEAYLQCHERDWVADHEKLFTRKINFSWNLIHDILTPYFENSLNSLSQVFLADYNGKLLYNFSIVNTRLANHFGLVSISPLLSEEMISFATHLPCDSKYDQKNNIGKLPLRNILSKYKADSLITEEKLGFNVNTLNLWKFYGKELCKQYLLDSNIVKDNWINKDWIEKYIDKEDLDVKIINKFLGLLALEIWYRLFITKEINSDTKLD